MEAELVLISRKVFTGVPGCDAARPAAIGVCGDRICWVVPLKEARLAEGSDAANAVKVPDTANVAKAFDRADVLGALDTADAAKVPGAAGRTEAAISPSAEVLDLGDAFIMPGFHDAHLHFFHSALYASPLAERFVGISEEDCVRRLAPLAARRPAGSWLLAQGWREAIWDVPCMPSKHSLDAAYPDRPVAMYSGDAHTLWLNSRALEELGLDCDSQPPAGGVYERDEGGQLTGIVRETAAMELMPRITAAFGEDELLDAYRSFLAHLNAQGITAACDMALAATPGLDFVRDDLFERLLATDELTVRMHLFPTLLPGTRRLADLQACLHDPLLQACGFKQFFDGVSSQHTAWLHDPYTNARSENDCGRPTVAPAQMAAMMAEAAAAGQGVRIHTIGDEAIHQALDIHEGLLGASAGSLFESQNDAFRPVSGPDGNETAMGCADEASAKSRPKCVHGTLVLEHLENFQPSDIARLARLGVVASVQPRHITLDPGGPERDLGPDRVPYMWPFRSLLDAGAMLAFGTDSPVTATNPLAAVYTAVTRKDADTRQPEGGWLSVERITVAEALRAYTLGSAAAAGRAHELGTLEPGKLADMTVLSADPLIVDPEDIPAILVQATYVGGRKVYPI